GMETIAEGIETQQQLEKMRNFGCEFAQGYLFSGAVDARSAGMLIDRSLGTAETANASLDVSG
ncbi:MAG: EAL domain-containing protein, partial [Cyanobacteriota bacterium]|nr:EAL domain-containing protein [Cyanobacteriota bacterium]